MNAIGGGTPHQGPALEDSSDGEAVRQVVSAVFTSTQYDSLYIDLGKRTWVKGSFYLIRKMTAKHVEVSNFAEQIRAAPRATSSAIVRFVSNPPFEWKHRLAMVLRGVVVYDLESLKIVGGFLIENDETDLRMKNGMYIDSFIRPIMRSRIAKGNMGDLTVKIVLRKSEALDTETWPYTQRHTVSRLDLLRHADSTGG
jgi:hypothetical protein